MIPMKGLYMLFAYRIYGDDRDSCAYVDERSVGTFGIHGPCFSMQFGRGWRDGEVLDYDDVETILSREEFEEARDNGLSMEIIEKLASPEGLAFANAIMESEKDYIMREHNLTLEDVNCIIDEYGQDYRDRGIVSVAFNSWTEAAEDEAWQLGYVNNDAEARYFNYDAFVDDMQEDYTWMEVPSGKVVHLMY